MCTWFGDQCHLQYLTYVEKVYKQNLSLRKAPYSAKAYLFLLFYYSQLLLICTLTYDSSGSHEPCLYEGYIQFALFK